MSVTERFHDESGRTITAGMLARLAGQPIPEPFVLPVELRDPPPARAQRRPTREESRRAPQEASEEEAAEPAVTLTPPARRRALYAALCARDMTQREIAAELGVSPQTVSQNLKAFGLKARLAPILGCPPRGGENDDLIRHMALAGDAQTDIAKALGMTGSGVCQALVRLRIHGDWQRARAQRLAAEG